MPLVRVDVEAVHGRTAYRRFVELPYLLHGREPRWAAPLATYERSRLDLYRNPFFDDSPGSGEGEGRYLLVRKGGKVVGRMSALVARRGDPNGWFGDFDVADDDELCTARLLDEAAEWLGEQGCTTMTGPVALDPAGTIGGGVLVDGFDAAGTTGRPWHPRWYEQHLRAAGLVPADGVTAATSSTWQVALDPGQVDPALRPDDPAIDLPADSEAGRSGPAGAYADRRLHVTTPSGLVEGVPDLHSAGGASAPLKLAKVARKGGFTGCTIVRCDGDPARLVSAFTDRAAAAGYRWAVVPWTSDPATPAATTHARFTRPI